VIIGVNISKVFPINFAANSVNGGGIKDTGRLQSAEYGHVGLTLTTTQLRFVACHR